MIRGDSFSKDELIAGNARSADTSNISNEELGSDSDLISDAAMEMGTNEIEMSFLLSSPSPSSVPCSYCPKTSKGGEEKSYRPSDRRGEQSRTFILGTSRVNLFSSLTFNWFLPLLDLGNCKEQLDPEDLDVLPLPPSCQADPVSKSFEYYWDMAKEKSKIMKSKGEIWEPSVARCLFRAYGKDYFIAGLLKLVHDINIFVGPVVLHGLVEFLSDPNAPLRHGLLLTLYVTLSQLIMSLCLRHYFFKCYLCGLRMRSALVVQLYKKALVLSSAERQRYTVGEIMNLMTVDAQRIQDLTTYLHAIWYSFVQIGLSIFFLWRQLGPSCVGGLAVIVIMVPLNKAIAGWMGHLQKTLMKSRDLRVDLNNEVIGNMKEIKAHGWEDSFQERILLLRSIELRHLFHYVMADAFSIMMWTAVPLFVALATFTCYVALGNKLDAANALTSLALFDILRFPLFMLPQVVNNLVEAGVSFERLHNFLLSEDHTSVSQGSLTDCGIEVLDGTFIYENKKPIYEAKDEKYDKCTFMRKELYDKEWEIALLKAQLKYAEDTIRSLERVTGGKVWKNDVDSSISDDNEGPDHDLLTLRRINFRCNSGDLIAVVGSVGSGKSTFLKSILGEVKAISGTLAVKGSIAYCPQMPFIMNDTIRRNVVFGKQDDYFEQERYERSLSLCALEHDLSKFCDGDLTEVGEKGITLSGGQKARLALARALYQDADIYLLDDPLSAVDAHVGKHIFEKCIIDEMLLHSSSTRRCKIQSIVILVTNSIQYLSNHNVRKIIVMENGEVAEVGSFADLASRKDSIFSSFLSAVDETHVEKSLPSSNVDGYDVNLEFPEISRTLSSTCTPCQSSNEARSQTQVNGNNLNQTDDDWFKYKSNSGSDSKSHPDFSRGTPVVSLTTNEFLEREKGHVDIKIYLGWAKAAGGTYFLILLAIGYAVDQGVGISCKWWLTYWSRNEGRNELWFLRIYAYINFLAILTIFMRVVFIYVGGLRSSRILFKNLLDAIMKAPMSFFDTTPTGRILNRFSKDVYTLDENLVATMRSYLATLSSVIGTVIVVSFVTPTFTFCMIPIILFYIKQQRYFTNTYRELKRIDSVSRSPLYALLGETLDGILTIRAFNAEPTLMKRLVKSLDLQQNAYYLTTTAQCWLAIRLELIGTFIIFSACTCAVLEHGPQSSSDTFAGLAGLSISFALSVTQSLNWSVRMSSDLEAHMISVERIQQYCRISSEAPHYQPIDNALVNWPSNGEIIFSSVQLRYRKNLPLILKDINLRFPARSKIGIVGRTGAGKSTIVLSLLRLVELSNGEIEIDGLDISKVGLKRLRSMIAVIPQSPVLFSGTIRTNLDPFNEYSDDRLQEVLQRVGLLGLETRTSSQRLGSAGSINYCRLGNSAVIKSIHEKVHEGGSNLSVGQRQLLVIARSMLHGSKIVIMDEATASVDPETDAKIQRLFRTEFQSSTCITVAHRINTIMDSDFIVVMDNGRAVEFGSPTSLIQKRGLFKDLVGSREKEETLS